MASFTGGDKLQAHLAALAAKVKNAATVRVGFLEGATYPDGTSVAMVAAIQEFGAPAAGIPPRPFFRAMIAKESGHWGADIGKILAANGYDGPKALALMGKEISEELGDSIIGTDSPPLAPATAKAKGSDKPLVDTGHMLNSIDYEVKS